MKRERKNKLRTRNWELGIGKFLFPISCLLIWLVIVGTAQAVIAPDPTRLSLGCRVLSLGRSFIGLADDVEAVYTNPSGLAQLERWQFSSFQGSYLEEFSYLSLTGAYPTDFGIFGLGFANASIGGAPVTKVKEGTEDDPVYIVDDSQKAVSYYNNVFILSYALDSDSSPGFVKGLFDRFSFLKSLKYGTNLKLFSAGLAGNDLKNANATGMDIDLGILYRHTPWFQVGVTAQNILPASMGGKLTYTNDHEETYPAILELGTHTKLLGKENALRPFAHDISLLLDYDIFPTRKGHPNLFHIGLEWMPSPIIAIRAGINQDTIGSENGDIETSNNLTGGVGLTYGGFRFDYAYHQFEVAPGVDNHFFALSYGIFPPEKKIEDPLVSSPDKVVTFQPWITVEGFAVDPKIVSVTIDGRKIRLSPRGEFKTNVALEIGKNAIMVEGYDRQGKLVDKDKLRILRLITYPDVAENYWTYEQVGYIGTLGIIKGYPDGTFRPEGDITRAEMSTLLVRTLVGGDENVPLATNVVFPDVPIDHWACKYVNLSYENEIVLGYPDGTFQPSGNITRAEGLTMVTRFSKVSEEVYADEFIDVSETHWAAKTIAGAYKAGMLIYLHAQPFEPSRKLTRAESVEILFRSPYVQDVIKNDLLNWDTY